MAGAVARRYLYCKQVNALPSTQQVLATLSYNTMNLLLLGLQEFWYSDSKINILYSFTCVLCNVCLKLPCLLYFLWQVDLHYVENGQTLYSAYYVCMYHVIVCCFCHVLLV